MKDQFQEFIKVLDAFDRKQVEYVLIGGVAMILHGMERLTRDIEIFVKPSPQNIKRLKEALYQVFHDNSIEEITPQELDKYPVIRYGTPDGFYIDIMTRPGETFSYEDLEYQIVKFQGTKVRVATPETLFRLKQGTIRDRDKIDALFLKELMKKSDKQ